MNTVEKMQDRLSNAIRNGDLEELKCIISSSMISQLEVLLLSDLLYTALKYDKQEVVELLLSHGCKVNSRDEVTESPLHLVARKGNVALVKRLLEKGASLSARDQTGSTPLLTAVELGHTLVVQQLLDQNNLSGVIRGSELQATVNMSDRNGRTPLIVAVEKNNHDIAKLLLRNGAEAHVKTKNDITSLHVASERTEANVKTQNDITPLRLACEYGDEEMCELLLEHGSDPNVCDEDRATALHCVVASFNREIAQLLLEKLADSNMKTKDGTTPLSIATFCENFGMCELLLKFQADPNVVNEDGKSLLYIAVENYNRDITELLIKYHANVDIPDKDGCTPLYVAIKCMNMDLAKLLISSKANVNILGKDGKSPLFLAAEQNNFELVRHLLESNANVNQKTKNNLSPLYIAAMRSYSSIFCILLQSGANLDAKLKKGCKTVMMQAIKKNCPEIVVNLLDKFKIAKENCGDILEEVARLENQNYDVLKKLFDYGLNLREHSYYDEAFVLNVVKKGYDFLLETLLKSGLDVNERIKIVEGGCVRSLLHVATESHEIRSINVLLQWGVQVDCVDKNGLTPLLIAFQSSTRVNDDVVRSLLNYDANALCRSNYGYYPIHLAYMNTRYFCSLDYFLSACTDLNFEEENAPSLRDLVKNYRLSDLDIKMTIGRHIIKLKEAELLTNETYLNLPPLFYKQFFGQKRLLNYFKDECREELRVLKNEKVGGLDLTFFEILSSPLEEVVRYLRIEKNLLAIFKERLGPTPFTNYWNMVIFKLEKASRRRDLEDEFVALFLSSFPIVPNLCVQKITNYLHNQDLRRIIVLSKRN